MRGELPARALSALLVAAVALLAPPGATDASAQPRKIFANPTQASLPSPGTADFDFGYVQYQGTVQLTVDVPGNSPWAVLVRCDDPDLGGYGKAVGDLVFRQAGVSAWSPASAVEEIFETGSGDAAIQIEVGMRLDWEIDPPDDYAGTLRFSIAAGS